MTVNTPGQEVTAARETWNDVEAVRIGSVEQRILGKKGDDLRIDWGYLYVAAPKSLGPVAALGAPEDLHKQFTAGNLDQLAQSQPTLPTAAPTLAGGMAFDLGEVAPSRFRPGSCLHTTTCTRSNI